MKTEYVFGGLALLGVIAIVAYIQKPKRNSDGFFNARGEDSFSKKQYYCRNERGQMYLSDTRDCKQGYRAVGSTVGYN
jgi:hypothetical protein